MSHSFWPRAIAVSAIAVAFAVIVDAQSTGKPSVKADGLLHSELSLIGRTASIAFAPDLRAADAANKSLFAPAGQLSGRARVGQLETNGALRFGSVSVGKPGATPIRFDLFVEAGGEGWQLDIVSADASGAAGATSLGKVALSRQPNTPASPMLIAALVPVARDSAQLVLTWGDVKASTGFQYQEVQAPARGAGGGAGRQSPPPINRKHDDENVGARQTMLSQMNEAALVDAQGSRVSMLFERSFPKGSQPQSAAGTTRRSGLLADGADFAKLATLRDGAVAELAEAPALKLSIDRSVRSGNFVLRSGNQAPGFAGSYSVWLKRAGSGWRFVFNKEADVWGSQRDPKNDIGEVNATHTQTGDATRPLGIALVPTGANSWRLAIGWGPHDWTADFAPAP